MNLQYSPRTETMISPAPYIDNMRVVAQQHDAPLFDRFAIMRYWSESGDFDLFSRPRRASIWPGGCTNAWRARWPPSSSMRRASIRRRNRNSRYAFVRCLLSC